MSEVPAIDGSNVLRQTAAALRRAVAWLGTPIVTGSVAALSLPFSAYYLTEARSYRQLVGDLQAHVDAYTTIQVGRVLPPIVGYDLDGNRLLLDPATDQFGALIFGVSGSCIYCLQSLDPHLRLAAAAEQVGRRVYWISNDGLDEALGGPYAKVAAPGRLLVEPAHASYLALGLGFTPQTALVSSDGIIEAAWKGVVDESVEAEIHRALGP